MILSPQAHDAACDLLKLPRGTHLSVAQVYEAASLEFIASRRETCDTCKPERPCKVHQ